MTHCDDRAKKRFIFTLLFKFRRVSRRIWLGDVRKEAIQPFFNPVISVAIIIWGLYLGFSGVGRYYVALGVFFLIMQGLMRYWLLPMMFKRQFVRYQFGKSEQGIDLYQDYFELYAAGRKQVVQYGDVQTFASK